MCKDRENWCDKRAATGERGATPLQITCVVYSLGLLLRRPNLSESLGAWEYHARFPVLLRLVFGQIFIVTRTSPLVTPAFSAAAFYCSTREKTAGPRSTASESLAQVEWGKAAHSRKYWNSITCGHLSHITCSVSICTLLFWGRHGLTDSTHLRFLQLPSVHEVFGCSYRKKTNLSITAPSRIALLNWSGRYFYLRFL